VADVYLQNIHLMLKNKIYNTITRITTIIIVVVIIISSSGGGAV